MPTSEQLYLRALRMLHDGHQHSPAALAWARRQVGVSGDEQVYDELTLPETAFTLREISLGA